MTISRQAAKVAERFARHPGWILALALVFSALAAWAAAQLPVYTSRQALLPRNTPVTDRLNAFLKNFGAASDLVVVLEGLPRPELEAFGSELAGRLGTEPEIGQVADRLDLRFFLEHAYLLAPDKALRQLDGLMADSAKQGFAGPRSLDESLGKALAWTRDHPPLADFNVDLAEVEAQLNAANFMLQEWRRWLEADKVPDALDWSPLLAGQGMRGLAEGYFVSRDGRMLFLFVHPSNPSEDFPVLGPFVEKVKSAAAKLSEEARGAGRVPPTVALTGLPAIEYEEYVNIRKDIVLVIGTSAFLIAGLILVVVRSLRWAVIIFVPMGLGVLWSLGLALVTVGHLTVITAAFIAILFGLGADYGIFTSSRIAEERRAGTPLLEAIGRGIGSSFGAVLTAGGASLLIFGALGTVDFPGFSELGIVAAKGVLMILVSTWTVQPALYALLPPRMVADSGSQPASLAAGARVRLPGAYPRPLALVIVLVAVGCAALGAVKGLAIPFDYDVLAMLPKDSQAARYQRRMVEESDYQAEVVIFTAKDMAEARRIAAEAGKFESIAQAQSLTTLFPPDAEERSRLARSIADAANHGDFSGRIETLERAGLPEKTFELARKLLEQAQPLIEDAQEQAFSSGHSALVKALEGTRVNLEALSSAIAKDPEQGRSRSEAFYRALVRAAGLGVEVVQTWSRADPLTPGQLPPTLRDRFFGKDGSIAVYAFPAKTVYVPANLDRLIKDVYSISPNATGFPTTHQAFSKAVVQSFSQGTLLALGVCLGWIVLTSRSLVGFLLASLPLLIGGGWMLGLMVLGHISYNYANIIALPLVIALAVDYGVWFSYRWRELEQASPLEVSLISGKVIGLAAGTELAGLGAITLASYRGVSTLGVSITIGLLCCLGATLFVAPALGQLLDSKRTT